MLREIGDKNFILKIPKNDDLDALWCEVISHHELIGYFLGNEKVFIIIFCIDGFDFFLLDVLCHPAAQKNGSRIAEAT